jgi:hypothetical protein
MMEISRSGWGAGAVWFVSCPCVGSSPALCGPGPLSLCTLLRWAN